MEEKGGKKGKMCNKELETVSPGGKVGVEVKGWEFRVSLTFLLGDELRIKMISKSRTRSAFSPDDRTLCSKWCVFKYKGTFFPSFFQHLSGFFVCTLKLNNIADTSQSPLERSQTRA